MILETVLWGGLILAGLVLIMVYSQLIHPEKRSYDAMRAQGITGEPFVPLIGQLPQLRRYREADKMMVYYEDLTAKHGNLYLSSFGPVIRLVINEPELLAEVLSRNNAPYYIKPPVANAVFKPILGTHNLLISEGYEHERARRMLNPAFHHANLKSMISIMTDRTTKAIDSVLKESTEDANGTKTREVDLQVLFNMLTLSIIVSSAFGSDLETNADAKNIMYHVFSDVLDAVIYRSLRMINQIPFLSTLPFWKRDVFDHGRRLIGEYVDQIIRDRQQGRTSSMSNGPDLLDLLLSAVDDKDEPFTNEEVKEQALTFVLAGSETTGNLMVWVFYILMTHEEVLQACQEEVDRVLPNGTEPTNEHLNDLQVCEAVIHETLRLYPPAPLFTRHCVREHTIGTTPAIRIPAGLTILINSYTLHRRADLWLKPTEFDYRRWMRDPQTGLKPKLPHPFAYLPFAAGPRNCIGQNFALLEAKIMLAMFLQRCKFTLVPGQKVVPDLKITLRTKYGLWATIRSITRT